MSSPTFFLQLHVVHECHDCMSHPPIVHGLTNSLCVHFAAYSLSYLRESMQPCAGRAMMLLRFFDPAECTVWRHANERILVVVCAVCPLRVSPVQRARCGAQCNVSPVHTNYLSTKSCSKVGSNSMCSCVWGVCWLVGHPFAVMNNCLFTARLPVTYQPQKASMSSSSRRGGGWQGVLFGACQSECKQVVP